VPRRQLDHLRAAVRRSYAHEQIAALANSREIARGAEEERCPTENWRSSVWVAEI
jgi:hypothetical protein